MVWGNRRRIAEGLRILEIGKETIKWGKVCRPLPEDADPSSQPYPLPKTIAGSQGSEVACLSAIPGGGLEKSGPGSLPGTATTTDKHLGRGYADRFLSEELGG